MATCDSRVHKSSSNFNTAEIILVSFHPLAIHLSFLNMSLVKQSMLNYRASTLGLPVATEMEIAPLIATIKILYHVLPHYVSALK